MHIHDMEQHNGNKADYSMTILRKYKTSFERQNNEPARIKIAKPNENINSESEWNSQTIERIKAVQIGENYKNKTIKF